MLKKFLSLFLILFLTLSVSNICFATNDVLMDLDDETVDNTLYGSTETLEEESITDYEDTSSDFSVINDYDVSSDELSISNIINIIFIVVGIVLILLGIAIIIKLK